MATCEVKLPDELYKTLAKIPENQEQIIEKVLKSGAEIAFKAAKTNLRKVVGSVPKSRSTGELEASLGISGVDVDNKGVRNIKIGFNEPRRKQTKAKGRRSYDEVTNAMIGGVLEYGRRSASQEPKPFMRPAQRSSKPAAVKAMENTFDSELKKIL
jgi:HK97 gp10 family phage protein